MKIMQIARLAVLFGAVVVVFAGLSYQASLERDYLANRKTSVPTLGQTVLCVPKTLSELLTC
jgi:hypothetical protein